MVGLGKEFEHNGYMTEDLPDLFLLFLTVLLQFGEKLPPLVPLDKCMPIPVPKPGGHQSTILIDMVSTQPIQAVQSTELFTLYFIE